MRNSLKAMLLVSAALFGSGGALAQTAVEGRIDRLEHEMRAVQRKVFPGGGQLVAPDITSPASSAALPGTPASSPNVDMIARLHALETQMSAVTGQVEQAQHRAQLQDEAFAAYRRSTDARLKVLEEAAKAAAGNASAPTLPATVAATPPSATPGTKPKPVPAPAKPATPPADPARAQLVAAIEKPATGDAAEDGYVYGYRLWAAKLYPEAEAELKQVVAKYPTHRRASWAQNLLGRAYLDEGKPSLASLAFYDNYKKFHDGERAPDSLFYLAAALKKLGKPAGDVCKVYDELTDAYPDRITATMRADIARGRMESKCPAAK